MSGLGLKLPAPPSPVLMYEVLFFGTRDSELTAAAAMLDCMMYMLLELILKWLKIGRIAGLSADDERIDILR